MDADIDYTNPSYIPTVDAFVRYFEANPLKVHERDLLMAHYAAPNHAARTVEIADTLRIPVQSVHATYGRLGRRLEKDLVLKLPVNAIPTHVFSWFEANVEDGFRDLHMHAAVVKALEILGWDQEAVARFAEAYESAVDENIAPGKYLEGRVREVGRIERTRNGQARQECIDRQGTACCVCGFDFGAVYGERGAGFIEVHHISPIGELECEREIDPETDLRPVCSNCHRMLHRNGTNLTIEELKLLIANPEGRVMRS
ncbi:MAG: hypothetical protein WC829_03805 [Hyphomicrobium sp.]|jgi:hypothetical protein